MSEKKLSFVVEDVDEGARADKFLSLRCDNLSRSRLKSLVQDGHVSLNNKTLSSVSYKVCEGDVFDVTVPPVVSAEPVAENIPLNIVHEDDDLLIINKAIGMVVHPAAGHHTGTLVHALLHHCGDSLSGIGGVARPGIVHRLDKDTSGLMIVAKNDFAHQHLSAQLGDRSLSRIYTALVLGVPMPLKGTIDRAIGRHKHNRLKMSVMGASPREARTHYMVLERFGEGCALVECRLETGRTHQIRVHMEAFGYPLLGDPVYRAPDTKVRSCLKKVTQDIDFIDGVVGFGRQMLHARALQFIHPRSEDVMSFESDLPEDFQRVLSFLQNS